MNKDFAEFAQQIKDFGQVLKTEINKTRANINGAQLNQEMKESLLSELNNIEDAIANPDKGFVGLISAIQSLNNKFTRKKDDFVG